MRAARGRKSWECLRVLLLCLELLLFADDASRTVGPLLVGFCVPADASSLVWVWVKIKPSGDRRLQSMLYQGNPFWGYPILQCFKWAHGWFPFGFPFNSTNWGLPQKTDTQICRQGPGGAAKGAPAGGVGPAHRGMNFHSVAQSESTF